MATGRPARTRSAGTGGGEVKALDIETQMMVDGHDSEDHGALEDHGDSEDDNSDDDDDDSADDDSLRQVQELPARITTRWSRVLWSHCPIPFRYGLHETSALLLDEHAFRTGRRFRGSNDSGRGGSARCSFFVVSAVLMLVLAAGSLALWGYGLNVGARFMASPDGDAGLDDLCFRGALWVLTISAFSLAQVLGCGLATLYARWSMPDGYPDEANGCLVRLREFQVPLALFSFAWLVYGITIFVPHHEELGKACDASISGFGFVFVVCVLVFWGLAGLTWAGRFGRSDCRSRRRSR